MVAKLVERVNEKIAEEELLVIGVKHVGLCEMNAVIPDKIKTDEKGIHIEGENLMLDITNEEKYEVFFNETEDKFIIKHGAATYHLS